jgi:hypothetical protein
MSKSLKIYSHAERASESKHLIEKLKINRNSKRQIQFKIKFQFRLYYQFSFHFRFVQEKCNCQK